MGKPIQSFKELYAWQEGHKLVLQVYSATNGFPADELYVLSSQMRRCAISITSNIAEGFGRQSYKEKIQFYHISKGSLTELQNQLEIAKDLNYINIDHFLVFEEQISMTHRLINGLIKKSKDF